MKTRDLRVESIRPLLPPAILLEELPLSEDASQVITRARDEVAEILAGSDDRLIVIVGPCSVHDPAAAGEYARRLKTLSDELAADLRIVMRVYFEKPRTTVGWKGLINDPRLDGSFAINEGLRLARRLLLDLIELGLPSGSEFLDPITPQFTSDLVTWGAIGARTTESQVHRELASGLSMPVGFKNGTDGGVQIAIDALRAVAHPHRFLGVTEQGLAGIVSTRGNPDCHVILRGGQSGPNYDAGSVGKTLDALRDAGVPAVARWGVTPLRLGGVTSTEAFDQPVHVNPAGALEHRPPACGRHVVGCPFVVEPALFADQGPKARVGSVLRDDPCHRRPDPVGIGL